MNRAAITGNQTAHFTARELDVLAGLQKGRSNKWIARQLNLSENTVKVHIAPHYAQAEGHEPNASDDLLAKPGTGSEPSRCRRAPFGRLLVLV